MPSRWFSPLRWPSELWARSRWGLCFYHWNTWNPTFVLITNQKNTLFYVNPSRSFQGSTPTESWLKLTFWTSAGRPTTGSSTEPPCAGSPTCGGSTWRTQRPWSWIWNETSASSPEEPPHALFLPVGVALCYSTSFLWAWPYVTAPPSCVIGGRGLWGRSVIW